ncbi:MAG TPA: UDP-N-acetylmuramoyl-L-alanyl-D-glutamate--2,6-diaminopimelate ligase [Opitutae bacterium]|nr:UDP-N-acetylmuramoyl-L-alanyl-D-glutamate--2,6-diaminopimelate ligase [Opitutae bacterium]
MSAAHATMEHASLTTLLKGIPTLGRSGMWHNRITAIVTDSRRMVPGALFFALDGIRSQGHAFVNEAVARGAAAIISAHPVEGIPGADAAQVAEPRKVLAEVSRRFYGHPETALRLAAVTGTNGKTTVTTLLRHLLEQAEHKSWGLIGTVRYQLGARSIPSYKTTPESADLAIFFRQMVDADCVGACLEVSSHALEQDRVHGYHFSVAAFTNLTRDHIDYHGDLVRYLQAKARLFDGSLGVRPHTVVLNADDPASAELARLAAPSVVLTFGLNAGCDLQARTTALTLEGASFEVTWKGRTASFTSRLPGTYNVSNVLCALGCAAALGHDPLALAAAVESFPGVSGRMERVEAGQAFPVFVDYAHTDDALRNALGMLRAITPGRVLCVFGCGGNRDRGKRLVMTQAVAELAHRAWATADNPRRESLEVIFDDMRPGAGATGVMEFVADRREAIARACAEAKSGDCVLIAGKGHETTQEFAETVVPFDDRQVARDVLRNLQLRRS